MQACIDACTKCAQACFECFNACLNEPDLNARKNCDKYIVVHEMCHLVHMNHSKEFWQLLKRVLPDYENRKVMLKNNGVKYDL